MQKLEGWKGGGFAEEETFGKPRNICEDVLKYI
jgi:hypothetical protein